MTINFYLERNKDVADVKTIYCYVRANNKTLQLSTVKKVNVKYWNKEFQCANSKLTRNTQLKSELQKLNSYLGKFRDKIKLVEEKLQGSDVVKKIHFNELKPAIMEAFNPPPPPKDKTFFEVYDDYIEVKKSKVKGDAIQKYNRFKNILMEFSDYSGIGITFKNIDFIFEDKFFPFLISELRMQNNTAYHQVRLLKIFMKWATQREYNTNEKYKSFLIEHKSTTIVTLSEAEIRKLYDHDFKNERLERTRDIFVFQCQVGARYSDIFKMDRDDIKRVNLSHRQIKTKNDVEIELSEIALEILRKYYDYPEPLPVISEQKMNKYIKEACGLAGINEVIKKYTYRGNEEIVTKKKKFELISTHTARRSFITNSLIAGNSIPEVMSESGHKSLSSFQKYIDLSNSMLKEIKSKKSHLRVVK